MSNLEEVLLDPARRGRVVADCVALVESEVGAKSGLSGMAVKGAFAVVRKLKPGIIRDAVDHLLDEFVKRLAPFYADFSGSGSGSLESFLSGRAGQVANALLGVTDARAARAQNATIKKAYEKLRPSGLKHVEAAVPGIAQVISKHV